MSTTARERALKVMRIDQVSEEINVPVNTLRYWRRLGVGPASSKFGGRVVYRREDVEAWVAAQFEEPA